MWNQCAPSPERSPIVTTYVFSKYVSSQEDLALPTVHVLHGAHRALIFFQIGSWGQAPIFSSCGCPVCSQDSKAPVHASVVALNLKRTLSSDRSNV
jgi:hypothetical protein